MHMHVEQFAHAQDARPQQLSMAPSHEYKVRMRTALPARSAREGAGPNNARKVEVANILISD